MRPRVSLLNVLVIAPTAALVAVATGSTTRAHADVEPPQPIAVAIDPGHGGSPSATDPTQPFDPGTIGVNGLLEKDVTLDVAKRLAVLLRADDVQVALTRTGDTSPDVNQREQVAINAHADVFVSIHCNSFSDPSVGGSLVLYPTSASQTFAQTLSDALRHGLAATGVAANGIQLRDNWWTHAPMPTSTVEIAYLSNPREAALLASAPFREDAAAAIRDGIERFDPRILQRKAAITAWQQQHQHTPPPAATAPPAPVQHAGGTAGASSVAGRATVSHDDGPPWLLMLGVFAAITAALRWRRGLITWCMSLELAQPRSLRHASARRRRRHARAAAMARSRQWAPRSVYDDLSF